MPSAIDTLWIGVASISLMLAVIHLEAWRVRRHDAQQLMLAALGAAVSASAWLELAALRSVTVADYAWAYRWTNALILPMVVATVLLVLSVLPGRRWLAASIIALRVVATVASFTSGDSLGFREFTSLRQVVLPWGDMVSGPMGTLNPWVFVGQASNVLLVVFLVDALVRLNRRPPSHDRGRRLRVVVGVLTFVVLVMAYNVAVVLFGAPLPVMVAPHYLLMMLVVGRELSSQLARSAELADALELSESSLHETLRDIDLAERVGGLAVWTWRPGADGVELSQSGRTLAGLDPGVGPSLLELGGRLDPEDMLMLRERIEPIIRGESDGLTIELRIGLPNGERRWLAIYGRASRLVSGALLELHGVAFDLTAQRAVDDQFKVVVGASPAAMLLVADDGRILMANEAAIALTGYAMADLLGRSIESLVPEESRRGHPADRKAYTAAASHRRMSPRRDVVLVRSDGRRVPVEVALNAVTLNGRAFVVAAVIDLSERLEKDREIASQRDMLAHLSRVGLLSELSGSLAHEINQPLTAILSNAQASVRYMDRPEPDLVEVREGLVQVIEGAKRAGEVIRRLRAMLRKDPPEIVMLDINDVVAGVVRIVRSDLIERGIALGLELEEGLPAVPGDQVQLQQVLINLITNACEAMSDRTLGKHIRLRSAKVEGGVEVSVADTGHGIPEADLAKVFEPFVSTKATGLGFGLALCTTLVQAQGGRIWATNNAEGGATFHVLLARERQGTPDPADPDPASARVPAKG